VTVPERLGRDLQRQVFPPAAQGRLVLGLVRHATRHLRDVMSTIGIVLVGSWDRALTLLPVAL